MKKYSFLVNSFLEDSAEKSPGKTALVCDEQRLTYADIDKMANKMANALIENGLKHGDRVIICLHNSVELVVSIFAVLKAGGIFVPVNATIKPGKLCYLAQNARAAALVLPSNQTGLAFKVVDNVNSILFTVLAGDKPDMAPESHGKYLFYEDIQRDSSDARPACSLTKQDLACLIYTSGSTGDPKGVMSGHDNIVFAASAITSYLDNRPEDIIMNVLPLSFDYGLYQVLMGFKIGGTLILERSFTFPARTLTLMATEKVTGFPAVPTIFAILLKMDLSSYDLTHLRYITNTAAALPTGHIRGIQEKFPGVSIYSMYGLTETKRTLYLPPDQLNMRPDSVGIPIPGTEAWVEDELGNRLGPNQTGELVIRGPHVMRGYWENPEATAARYRSVSVLAGPDPSERLCYSGDLFYMDDDGYFYFVGRRDDIIKSRGEKVPPKEIESVLYELPDVLEAAVMGVSDPLLGQAIKAYLVLQQGSSLTKRDILRHCRANLEDFMVPQLVEFREALPKNASGKIAKRALG